MGKHEVRRPAIFLDRDGTIIRQIEELINPTQIELLPGVADAIAFWNTHGFSVIVLTNQPVIEKGLLSREGLEKIHNILREMLVAKGARLDAIYTCPHKYRAEGQCACRKPGLGLVQRAQNDFDIDMEHSWMVGDRLRDIELGRRAGIKTILVETGGKSDDDDFFSDAAPDFRVSDLKEAVLIVCGEQKS